MVVRVEHGAGTYRVVTSPGLAGLGEAAREVVREGRCVVVSDTTVGPLWMDAVVSELRRAGFSAHTLQIPAGEPHKHMATWSDLVDALLGLGLDRQTPIFALGGGVVGDVVGFAAASVLRGVPFIQVPTTTLAMIDSSVGGKTGVNHSRGKNLIGAFYAPMLVWAGLNTLTTLDPRARAAGLAEAVKAALLDDAALFAWMEANAGPLAEGQPGALAHVITAAVRVKARVVAEDERERGRRALLNLGHTVGHAVERVAGFGTLLHGEAVAVGMAAELRWMAAEGVCAEALVERVCSLCTRLGLPVVVPDLDPASLRDAMELDKKRTGARLSLPVVSAAGRSSLMSLPVHRLSELLS